MKIVTPDYYSNFECVGGICPDNCCIGWEIDINDEMYAKYMDISGELGDKLRKNIILSDDGSRCFKLTKNDRCPFLDKNNLCEIILQAGEEMLCDICNNHPRFHNCFGELRETGVGLSCIKAAELIMGQDKKTEFTEEITVEEPFEIDYDEDLLDYLIQLRSVFIDIVQDRNSSIRSRCGRLLHTAEKIQENLDKGILGNVCICNYDANDEIDDAEPYISILRELIPLNDEWTAAVDKLTSADIINRKPFIEKNEIIAEQLLVYYIFRHFLSAVYDYDILSKLKFAIFCTAVSFWICDDSITESVCLVSKEIEYCSENIDSILDLSWTDECMSTKEILKLM